MELKTDLNSTTVETQSDSPRSKEPKPEKKESALAEIIRFSLIALIIVLPIRLFVAQPFIVSGASMQDTFESGEYLIVDQLTYHFEEPQRGDVVIFRYPKDPSKFFIKRIIGVPGDTLEINGTEVTITNEIHPDGVILDETYIKEMKPSPGLSETLGEEEYFVMGDNRNASSDSRSWGVLQRDSIVGRALLRLFPLTSLGVFPGSFDIDNSISN